MGVTSPRLRRSERAASAQPPGGGALAVDLMQHEHQKGADLTDLQPSRDFLPFFRPDIREEEIAEVVDALRNGWLTTGPKTRRFEQDFARYMGPEVETVAVNSATAGLHLALEAAGIGPGDEVITTTYTFTATAEVIR